MCEIGLLSCSPLSVIHHESYVRMMEGCVAFRPLSPGISFHCNVAKRPAIRDKGYDWGLSGDYIALLQEKKLEKLCSMEQISVWL